MRLDFSKFKEEESKSGNYKEIFVGTERYKKTSALVKINMAKIVAVCQKCSDEFTSINLEPIFENFGQMDLNDSYYLELASKKKWIIVTDDADLVKADIPGKNLTILTYGKASKRF
jgi:predicted nucleic acid-binding protein